MDGQFAGVASVLISRLEHSHPTVVSRHDVQVSTNHIVQGCVAVTSIIRTEITAIVNGGGEIHDTALTNLAEATGDAFIVQELAGWSSPAMAATYVAAQQSSGCATRWRQRDEVAQ